MYSPGACTHRASIYFRVCIYFPARHVLLFGMLKKLPGPSIYSPGACIRRVGVYFLARHVLLFVMIKNPGPSMYLPGAYVLGVGMCSYLA